MSTWHKPSITEERHRGATLDNRYAARNCLSASSTFPAANAIVEPARQAALPELVEPREVGPANAGISAANMIAGTGGYAIAGLVIWATLSTFWLFLADGLTFLLAGILVFGLGSLQ